MQDRMKQAEIMVQRKQKEALARIKDYDRNSDFLKDKIKNLLQPDVSEFLKLVSYCYENNILENWTNEFLLTEEYLSETYYKSLRKDGTISDRTSQLLLEKTQSRNKTAMDIVIIGADVTLHVTKSDIFFVSNPTYSPASDEKLSCQKYELLHKFFRKYKELENYFYREFDKTAKEYETQFEEGEHDNEYDYD